MKPELVRFSSHPRPFHVDVIRCHTPDCECTEVTFNLRELVQDDQTGAKPMTFALRMDGLTWKESDPPPRTPQIARMMEEFLRDYPLKEREAIRRYSEEKLRGARRLREYRIDPKMVSEGTLIPFGEILQGRPGGLVGPESWLDVFNHEGQRYLVDDLYCANPECRCEEAHLAFIQVGTPHEPGDNPVSHDFLVTLSFGGRAKIEECHGWRRARPRRSFPRGGSGTAATWRSCDGAHGEGQRDRAASFPRRTAVPRRPGFLRSDGLPAAELVSIGAPVGRNDPCPCGSGKKFKKCCGHAKSL